MYIYANSPRYIPVGYSAADDLRFRISLAKYLECGDELTTVDFYGVNSYQWCGSQTFTSSGYNLLVNDYLNYSLPLILSEYGCNAVMPRLFEEVEALYSPLMTRVFSGGLVYEYSQEPNNYGLVELDHRGNVYLRKDFDTLKQKLAKVKINNIPILGMTQRPLDCENGYPNLNYKGETPDSFAAELIAKGVSVPRGEFIDTLSVPPTAYHIFDTTNREILEKAIVPVQNLHPRVNDVKNGDKNMNPVKENPNMPLAAGQIKNGENTTANAGHNISNNTGAGLNKNSGTKKRCDLRCMLVTLVGQTLIGL
jgi:1,3-beta-glucanosyltransferase GAS4